MHITDVKICNFRCLKLFEAGLGEYHSFVGENGTGKTAILEAIDIVTSPYYIESRISEQDFNNADEGDIKIEIAFDKYFIVKVPDGYIDQLLPCKKISLGVKRRDRATSGKVLCDGFVVSQLCIPIFYSDKAQLDSNSLPKDVDIDDLPAAIKQSDRGYKIKRKSGKDKDVRPDTVSLKNQSIGFPNVFYIGKDREREAKLGFNTLFSKIAKDLNWRFRKDLDLESIGERWNNYYDEVINVVEDKKKREIVGPLRDKLSNLLGINLSDFEISLLNIEQPFQKAFVSRRSNLNQIALDRMGSGISMIIAFCLLELINEQQKESVIFLIDEPELHLHPQLQKQFRKHLEESSNQAIVSTHSPLMINLGNWEGIVRINMNLSSFPNLDTLKRKIEDKTIRDHLKELSKYFYHETLYSENDAELMFSRKIVFVEGPVEKYGVPRIAETTGIALTNISFVSCNGKNKIPHYALLCEAYEIPYFVLFDKDGKGLDKGENERIMKYIGHANYFCFETSFEHILGTANKEHKASESLMEIDKMEKDNVPDEFKKAIEAISKWAKKHNL